MVVNGESRDDVAEMLKNEGVVDVSSTQDQRRVTSQSHVHPSVRPTFGLRTNGVSLKDCFVLSDMKSWLSSRSSIALW